ncbi:metallophosphoesterase family protein [Tuwongella immobilis]|uniref:Calcineurin-like phosphoesterase domain-containing protein n=1 Tax=Tuwongella immobilis TaxID=692036 RepID=A0A6C2YH29_9BACT|nr:metallophosphoesterase family protein [Tuwongella immobilis]VIP00717.1 serine threonine protein phosphatase : Serine/threonine protein phosphatase OS=Chondromyces apiculatus DSM 436 GN=CAP_6578 PE=4 SV=1: Metallophos [Tuwongella immobilis]VTR96852.1 serine threonine protein phosphatase : Serine/threonine protein phosphatase OS=Chondromyces apiculatus DSM 436 GN=CAP_6578 PE=4 SV=1: Metallophos [Tuwongella immobilis]
MRTLAIGDIHGQRQMLDQLLSRVGPKASDQLVFLGDYVDRGPDSKGVIQRVREWVDRGSAVALRGNHEVMLLEARHSPDYAESWRRYGGIDTLASYAPAYREGSMSDIPQVDIDFLEQTCRPYFETGTHIFVHAGVSPSLPMEEQDDLWLYWEKLNDPTAHHSGKIVICGHTHQRSGMPLDCMHTICIDTWAYSPTGWLTCLDVHSGEYWQVNAAGQSRRDWLDPYESRHRSE